MMELLNRSESLRPPIGGVVTNVRDVSSALLAVMVLFTAMVVPPILVDAQMHRPLYPAGLGSQSFDMVESHLPQINFFIAHPWNLVDYPGVVTSLPGHDILLAWAARLLGYTVIDSKTLPIRLLHALVSGVGAMSLFLFLHRMQCCQHRPARIWMTTALWLSVFPSFYFLQSSIYISTDVPAAALYMAFLYFVIFHPRAIAAPTITATALVFWRQSYAAVLAAPFLAGRDQVLTRLSSPHILSLVVPTAVLLFYIIQFGGLVPPNAVPIADLRNVGSLFPQSILHSFAYLGLVLPVYLLIFAGEVRCCYRSPITIRATLALSSLFIILWAVVPSTYNYNAGRWGSILWTLSEYSPHWANHSVLVLFLGIFGAAFTVLLARLAVYHREVRPVVAGMFFYLASQIVVPLAFQRYVEPVILMSLALIAARCVTVPPRRLAMFATVFGFYGLAGLLRIFDLLPVGWITR
jgi:hypothetical protein